MAEQPLDRRFAALAAGWDIDSQAGSLDEPDHQALFVHWVATAQQRLADGRASDAINYLEAAERQAEQGGADVARQWSRSLAEAIRAETRPLELEEAVPWP